MMKAANSIIIFMYFVWFSRRPIIVPILRCSILKNVFCLRVLRAPRCDDAMPPHIPRFWCGCSRNNKIGIYDVSALRWLNWTAWDKQPMLSFRFKEQAWSTQQVPIYTRKHYPQSILPHSIHNTYTREGQLYCIKLEMRYDCWKNRPTITPMKYSFTGCENLLSSLTAAPHFAVVPV